MLQFAPTTDDLVLAVVICRMGEWTREFADSVKFTGDPVVSIPDVTEIDLGPHDEFVIIATDGLW